MSAGAISLFIRLVSVRPKSCSFESRSGDPLDKTRADDDDVGDFETWQLGSAAVNDLIESTFIGSSMEFELLNCLPRKWAEIFDGALRALRFLGQADAAAVVLHQVAEAHPLSFRDDCHQVGFDLVRIGFGREAEPLR